MKKHWLKLAFVVLLLVAGVVFISAKASAQTPTCTAPPCTTADIQNATYTLQGPESCPAGSRGGTSVIKQLVANFGVSKSVTFVDSKKPCDSHHIFYARDFCGGNNNESSINIDDNAWLQPNMTANYIKIWVPSSVPQKQCELLTVKHVSINGSAGTGTDVGGSLGVSTSGTGTVGGPVSGSCGGRFLWVFPSWDEFLKQTPDAGGCTSTGMSIFDEILAIGMGVLDILVRLGGILAIVNLIIAGITYMTAAGDVSGTAGAKRRIYNSFIGLGIVAVAASVVSYFGNRLG